MMYTGKEAGGGFMPNATQNFYTGGKKRRMSKRKGRKTKKHRKSKIHNKSKRHRKGGYGSRQPGSGGVSKVGGEPGSGGIKHQGGEPTLVQ